LFQGGFSVAEPTKRFILNAEQRTYVEQDWGHEDWIWNGRYCGKKLFIKKGKSTDWVHHRVKDKVLYVESGQVVLTYGYDDDSRYSSQLTLSADAAFHVPPGMYHSIKALEESRLLELSTHHSEKDVYTAGQELEDDTDADDDDSSGS
jgi:mannose-6-phosphate isomerase-like protein (cupin superfamily)